MHMYFFSHILTIVNYFGTSLIVSFSLPLFLFMLVVFMAPKCKSTPARNPLHSGVSSSSNSAPLSLFGFVTMMLTRHSRRTFLDEVFIRNAKSFWRTLPTLNFPLSFTVGNGSHCVRPDHLSSRAYPGVLLQYARDWSFNTSFLHLCLRYTHSYYTATCCGYASGP